MQRYGAFIHDDAELALLDTVRRFVDREIMPVRRALDSDRDACERVYEGLVKLGIQKRGFSERYGGLGIRSAPVVCALTEEIARGDAGVALHSLIPPWCMAAAIGARNNTVVDRFVPMFCEDRPRKGCMAITEPAGGCNIKDAGEHGRTIRTIARPDGDSWVINGQKMWPSGAGEADLYCVVCTTDPDLGTDGVALIYVPAGTPGLSFGPPEPTLGMRVTDVNAAIYFDDVRVPKDYRAGGPGLDWKLLRASVGWGRLTSAPMAIGAAQAVLETVIDYTGTRSYGGKPVRGHSMQAGMIAEMAIAVESARALYLSVAAMFNDRARFGGPGDDFLHGRASAAKVHACEVTGMVVNRAMELMGANGYSPSYPVEKYLRDSKIIQLWLGGGQLARLDVAQSYYQYFS